MLLRSSLLRFLLPISMFFLGTTCLVAQTSIMSGTVYTLVSKTSGLPIDNGGSTTVGTALQQNTATVGNTNQQWRINSLGSGMYQLICLSSGMALDTGGSVVSDTAVVQNAVPSATDIDQQWEIVSVANGYYQIVSASSGMVLDNGGSTGAGGSVLQAVPASADANQMWQIAPVQIGANTPFISYEAESGTLAGGATIVSLTAPPTTKLSSPELEASGHAYVNLGQTGASVSWVNNTGQTITAINVRYSIPDAPAGGGITSTLDLYVNGVLRQALSVNSKQTWEYETDSSYNGASKDPSFGSPHVFWDETHAFISGAAVAPGSTITLQMDPANTASYYNIDVVDLEAPPAPLTQPANSLSLTTDCGGQANNASFDNTTALQTCFANAASENMSVWIPQGTFYLNTSSSTTGGWKPIGITVQGAGMWYSTIYYNPPLPQANQYTILRPASATLKNFAIDGNAVAQSFAGGYSYAINISGSNWLVDSVWIQHEGPGIWADGSNGTVQNSRIDSTWADGINLNNGSVGNNLTARNNFIRGTGDDGLAINDGSVGTEVEMQSPTLVNNTVVAPWWADNMGVYGGQNDLVANNLLTDSVKEYGINIGPFGTGDPVKSAAVQGNVILRGGSLGYGLEHAAIGVGVTGPLSSNANINVNGNTIDNALFDGMDVMFMVNPGIIAGNTINSPWADGILITSPGNGGASFICNTITNPAGVPYDDLSSSFLAGGSCNTGFTVPATIATPTVTLSLSPTSITAAQALTANVTLTAASGKPAPTGSVVLTSGGYTSAPSVLSAGLATITVSAGVLGSGTDTLLATYTPDTSSSSIYSTSSGTASVNVGPSFTLSSSGAITVLPGATTGNTATITLTPLNSFSGSVALACVVTTTIANPADTPTCSIPSTMTVAGTGAVTATLTINTTAAIAYAAPSKNIWGRAAGTVIAAMLLWLIPPGGRRRRLNGALAVLLFTVCGMGLGCSSNGSVGSSSPSSPINPSNPSSSPGTTLGNYTVTVTGTDGTIAQSTAVNVTVN